MINPLVPNAQLIVNVDYLGKCRDFLQIEHIYPAPLTGPAQGIGGRPFAEERRAEKKLGWHGRKYRGIMSYSQAEKMEIIRLVEGSDLPVKRTLTEIGVPRGSFYRWYRCYREKGY